jgi:F0F1-type ATP synthase delta subunit
MSKNFSHRRLAQFIADEFARGESSKRIAEVLAAYLREVGETRQWELLLRDIESELEYRHGILSAEITSARPLSRETLDEISRKLRSEKGVKNVQIVPSVDESLLGGFVLRTPRSELDTSISRKLRKLKNI